MQVAEMKHLLRGAITYTFFFFPQEVFNDYIWCNFAFGGSSPAYLNKRIS